MEPRRRRFFFFFFRQSESKSKSKSSSLFFFFFFFDSSSSSSSSSSSVEEKFFLRPISHSDACVCLGFYFFVLFGLFATRPFVRLFLNHNNQLFCVFFAHKNFYIRTTQNKMLQLSSSRTIISPSSTQFTNKRKSSSLNNNRRSNNNGGFLQISAISAADVTGPVKETLGDLQSVEVRNFGNNSSLWSNSINFEKNSLFLFVRARGRGGEETRSFAEKEQSLFFFSFRSSCVRLGSLREREWSRGSRDPQRVNIFPA